MKVFKFGGASVKSAEAVRNVARILDRYRGEPLLVVISAMGKTTNALETLTRQYYQGDSAMRQTIAEIRAFHDEIIQGLLPGEPENTYDDIENLFIELEGLMSLPAKSEYDFVYDQLVSFGEIISTRIISIYLNRHGHRNRWADARNFIFTDHTWREGKVLWDETRQAIRERLKPIVERQMVITQGFMAGSQGRNTVTLGREGSDYSAAIFSWALEAESLTIWKDVAGVMNADPKRWPEAVLLNELSYSTAIELAYYGASVLHPRTVQPLQQGNIPLYVRSFIDFEKPGTVISATASDNKTLPFYIFKSGQALLKFSTLDFSFIAENHLNEIFGHLAHCKLHVNLMQHSALSFSVCVADDESKLNHLRGLVSGIYKLEITNHAELVTVRNLKGDVPERIIGGRNMLLKQHSADALQLVLV